MPNMILEEQAFTDAAEYMGKKVDDVKLKLLGEIDAENLLIKSPTSTAKTWLMVAVDNERKITEITTFKHY